MDKKKIIGIPVLVGLIAIVACILIDNDSPKGDKFEAMVQTQEATKADSVKAINMYIDFSGSMRGYIDFAGIASGKNTFISTVSSMLDNLESDYHVESMTKCGLNIYPKDKLRLAMQNKSVFNGQTTSIQDMIHEARTIASDNSLSIVVSDMVMSWGKKKIIASKDTLYNLTQLDGLGAAIHSEMKAVKNSGLDVVLVQYLSDYNGRYYCNYTENLKSPDKYRNKKMEGRPFYIFFIGKSNLLKDMLYKNAIKDYENIYASFDVDKCSKAATYEIEPMKDDQYAQFWKIGDAQNPNDLGTIWTDENLGNSQATFTLTCKDFSVPAYCFTKSTKLTAVATPNVISTASVKYPDFSIDLTLNPYNNLATGDVELHVICNNNWAEVSSTNDDINEEKLEGKTWGLAKVIENIDAAFFPQGRDYDQVVGIFKFRIQK